VIEPPAEGEFLIDLACGDRKSEGYVGLDIAHTASVDHVVDLTCTPWPIADCVVDKYHCSHFFEHMDGHQRIAFMQEAYRTLKDKGSLTIVVPYWTSQRSVQDPTHVWPPLCEYSFMYFNRKWMRDNKLEHYGINCDFDFTYSFLDDTGIIDYEANQFAVIHFCNRVTDLVVILTKRPPDGN
jgi:hypothetical protein